MPDITETAQRAAQEAGTILKHYFEEGFNIRLKGTADLVTDADVAAEQKVAEIILADFPEHSILGEEGHTADVASEHLWIVDPLDGTTNFAHGFPHFAVSIAYYHQGQPECGVVWNPIRDDLYTAVRGGGAFHNGRPMRVAEGKSMSDVLIGVGFYYDRGEMMQGTLSAIRDCFGQKIHGIRRCGTASLDLAHVAGGLWGGYFEYELNAWDFAAGRLLVEEAGGVVTNCSGDPLPIGRTSVLAGAKCIAGDLTEITRRYLPE